MIYFWKSLSQISGLIIQKKIKCKLIYLLYRMVHRICNTFEIVVFGDVLFGIYYVFFFSHPSKFFILRVQYIWWFVCFFYVCIVASDSISLFIRFLNNKFHLTWYLFRNFLLFSFLLVRFYALLLLFAFRKIYFTKWKAISLFFFYLIFLLF